MVTILQVDANFKQNEKLPILEKNISKLTENGNNYRLEIDDSSFVSLFDLKICKLLQILKKLPDDETVLYLDAFDTYVTAKDQEIEERFNELNVDVLFSSEKNCWPDGKLKAFFENERFLNSGSFIFKNKKFQNVLEILSRFNFQDHNVYTNDQYLISLFFLISNLDIKIKLDKENEIFQCLFEENVLSFELKNEKIYNKNTNTYPIVFHGNGTDGFAKIKRLFNLLEKNELTFLSFTDDKMGIYFSNYASKIKPIQTRVEVRRVSDNAVVYADNLSISFSVNYFVHLKEKNNYVFNFYNSNNELLLEVNNDHKIDIINYIDDLIKNFKI